MLKNINPRRSQALMMLHDGSDFVVGLRGPMITSADCWTIGTKSWPWLATVKVMVLDRARGWGEIVLTMDVWREFICLVGSGAAKLL